jgi:hypothetical protein
MRTALTATAAVAASALLAMPALSSSAPAAPGVSDSREGTLTICLVGLGRHGRINGGGSVESLDSHTAISAASTGYRRPSEKCSREMVTERTRFSYFYKAKAPYYLRAVSSTQADGNDAHVTVTRRLNFRVLMDQGDDVKVTLTFGKQR